MITIHCIICTYTQRIFVRKEILIFVMNIINLNNTRVLYLIHTFNNNIKYILFGRV